MDVRPFYVRDFPADLHAYLEEQCHPGGAPSKTQAVIVLLREARRLELSVSLQASNPNPQVEIEMCTDDPSTCSCTCVPCINGRCGQHERSGR